MVVMAKPNITPSVQHIAQNFASSHDTYTNNAVVQQSIAQVLSERLCYYPHRSDKVLEIGCGTGNLTRLICQNHQITTLYLNDLYDKICENPLATSADVQYLIGDIETLTLPQGLDLVVSGSCLQWVQDLPKVCQQVQMALANDGVFAFSSFGVDNLYEIKSLLNQGLDYYTLGELGDIVTGAGFEILALWEQKYTPHFDTAHAVLKHIQKTGVSANPNFRWNKRTLGEFYTAYRERFGVVVGGDVRFPLTYHAVFCIAKKSN